MTKKGYIDISDDVAEIIFNAWREGYEINIKHTEFTIITSDIVPVKSKKKVVTMDAEFVDVN